MKHKFVKHENCQIDHCNICDGGLAICEICNGAEGSLPSECPGEPMSADLQDDVYAGLVDFKDGVWIKRKK